MKPNVFFLGGLLLVTTALSGQPSVTDADGAPVPTLTALPGEPLLLPELKGIAILAAPPAAGAVPPPVAGGVQADEVPLLRTDAFAREMGHFLGSRFR